MSSRADMTDNGRTLALFPVAAAAATSTTTTTTAAIMIYMAWWRLACAPAIFLSSIAAVVMGCNAEDTGERDGGSAEKIIKNSQLVAVVRYRFLFLSATWAVVRRVRPS